jgi:hypothetical protein
MTKKCLEGGERIAPTRRIRKDKKRRIRREEEGEIAKERRKRRE